MNIVCTLHSKIQGRRLASFLERGCCPKDESGTIWSHPFHLWSCSEAHLCRLWGLQVLVIVLETVSIRFSGLLGRRWRQQQEWPVCNIQGGGSGSFGIDLLLRVNDHIGGYAVAAPIFAGIESKFGLRFPKFRESVIWLEICAFQKWIGWILLYDENFNTWHLLRILLAICSKLPQRT